jgi:hypothetical protein
MFVHVRWVTCQCCIVHPQVEDESDGLQVWSNCRQPTYCGPPAWRLRLTMHHCKKNKLVMKCHKGSQNSVDSLDKWPRNRGMRFCTSNVRNLYRAGLYWQLWKNYKSINYIQWKHRSDGTEVAPNEQVNIYCIISNLMCSHFTVLEG